RAAHLTGPHEWLLGTTPDPHSGTDEFLRHMGFLPVGGFMRPHWYPRQVWYHYDAFPAERDLLLWINDEAYDVQDGLGFGHSADCYRQALAQQVTQRGGLHVDLDVVVHVFVEPGVLNTDPPVGTRVVEMAVHDTHTNAHVLLRCLPTAVPTRSDIRQLQMDLYYSRIQVGALLLFGHPPQHYPHDEDGHMVLPDYVDGPFVTYMVAARLPDRDEV
ncbi:MAG: hypothetical protein KKA73_10690, partial [Chloroflexi bacterium]|nr:hypothetical protein [Chloroflexota bacterium]